MRENGLLLNNPKPETTVVVSAQISIATRDRLVKEAERRDMTNCEYFGLILEKGAK